MKEMMHPETEQLRSMVREFGLIEVMDTLAAMCLLASNDTAGPESGAWNQNAIIILNARAEIIEVEME